MTPRPRFLRVIAGIALITAVAVLLGFFAMRSRRSVPESTPALVGFCANTANETVALPVRDTELLGVIERVRSEFSDQSGMSFVLFDRDGILFEHYAGSVQSASGIAVDAETAFYIASSTKSLIATTVLMLCERGTLALDVPLDRYLPALHFKHPLLSEKKMTLRHLLCHDTGISSKALEIRTSMSGEWDTQTLVDLFGEAGYTFTRPQYSNLNYILAGLVLEQVTGETWQSLLKKNLFAPLGMNRSFSKWKSPSENIAAPHMLGADRALYAVPSRHNLLQSNTLFPSGGVIASARDLSRYVRLFLNCGEVGGKRLLSIDALREAITPQARNSGGGLHEYFGFGLGWELALHDSLTLITHGGSNRVGARAYMAFSPELGVGLVILSNENVVTPYVQGALAQYVWDRLRSADTATAKLDENLERWKEKVEARMAGRLEAHMSFVFDYPDEPEHRTPLHAFAGTYRDHAYGTVVVSTTPDSLMVEYGNLVSARTKRITNESFVTDFGIQSEPIDFKMSGDNVVRMKFPSIGIGFEKVEAGK